MIKGIKTSGASMPPMTVRMEVIANNLANLNSTGFKRDGLFVQAMKNAGATFSQGKGDLADMNTERVTDFTEGSLSSTSNPLDVAIQGSGFFAVETLRGVQYTRNGNFSVDIEGTLVTSQGFPVVGTEGRIVFPDPQKLTQGTIAISTIGEVSIDNVVLGRIKVVEFQDVSSLRKAGNTFFAPDPREAETASVMDVPTLRQGFLEESNVDGIREMVTMIELSRNFESSQKIIQAQDESVGKVIEMGRV